MYRLTRPSRFISIIHDQYHRQNPLALRPKIYPTCLILYIGECLSIANRRGVLQVRVLPDCNEYNQYVVESRVHHVNNVPSRDVAIVPVVFSFYG